MATNADDDSVNYTPESEIIYEGGPSADHLYRRCKKNNGHPTFIPVSQLTMEHLPTEWQTLEHLERIQLQCDLTVKITANYTSAQRPDKYLESRCPYPYSSVKDNHDVTRVGTGTVESVVVVSVTPTPDATDSASILAVPSASKQPAPAALKQPCQCRICKESGLPALKYWVVMVKTSTHVIYDHKEAAAAVVECFYDTQDKQGVKELYGIDLFLEEDDGDSSDEEFFLYTDMFNLRCVTHDEELANKLKDLTKKILKNHIHQPMSPKGIIISHPHGCNKQITLGNILYSTVRLKHELSSLGPHEFKKKATCRLLLTPFPDSTDGDSTRDEPMQTDDTPQSDGDENGNLAKRRRATQGESFFKSPLKKMKKTFKFSKMNKLPHPGPNSEIELEPGDEYLLPAGLTFTIPPDSESLCRSRYPFKKDEEGYLWINFPSTTQFSLSLSDGATVTFPADTEFNCHGFDEFETGMYYMSYDIATCPGSSGARLWFYNEYGTWNCPVHAGSLQSGLNRSSLQQVFSISFGE